MEIRCTDCGHLAAAAEVRPTDDGVGLVCDECGHVNVIRADSAEPGADEAAPEIEEVGVSQGDTGKDTGLVEALGELGTRRLFGGERKTAPKPVLEVGDEFVDNSIERLIPVPSAEARCRKCFEPMEESDDHCKRCGLSVERAAKYEPGQAPWEKPPPGKEEQQQRAGQMWEQFVGDEDKEIDEFVDYVTQQGLVDFGIRTVQKHLIEEPDDRRALDALEQLASSLEVAIEIAKTRAEAESDEFQEDVKEFRTRLLLGALVFWTALLLVFSWLFFDIF